MLTFSIKPAPPFRLDLTVSALRRLPLNAIDRWDGLTYRRTLVINGSPAEVSVVQTGPVERPAISVDVDGLRDSSLNRTAVKSALERLLGLDIELAEFYAMASAHRKLGSLARRFIGVKPPRFSSVFEAALNGIACQQLSLAVGIHLLNRICAAYGPEFKQTHAFPGPSDLAGDNFKRLRGLGYSERKSRNILKLSNEVSGGAFDIEGVSRLDDGAAMARLLEVQGVGRWTAQYVMLRGLGRLDVFPADDVGGRNKLMRWLNLKERPDYEAVRTMLEKWRPFRGIIYFLLLLDHQEREGYLKASRRHGQTS